MGGWQCKGRRPSTANDLVVCSFPEVKSESMPTSPVPLGQGLARRPERVAAHRVLLSIPCPRLHPRRACRTTCSICNSPLHIAKQHVSTEREFATHLSIRLPSQAYSDVATALRMEIPAGEERPFPHGPRQPRTTTLRRPSRGSYLRRHRAAAGRPLRTPAAHRLCRYRWRHQWTRPSAAVLHGRADLHT